METRRVHERIDAVESVVNHHLSEHKVFEARFTTALHENTELTKAIEVNTRELVSLAKGADSMRRFFIWASPIAAFFAGIWAFLSWLVGKGH